MEIKIKVLYLYQLYYMTVYVKPTIQSYNNLAFGTYIFRARFTSLNIHSSLLAFLSVYLFYLILAVQMRKCLGEHLCPISSFDFTTLKYSLHMTNCVRCVQSIEADPRI